MWGCESHLQSRRPTRAVSAIGQRKELETALGFVREGDTFVVTKLDRLARSTQHALSIVEDLENRGVRTSHPSFAGEPIATKSPHGKLVLTMFAAFAEFEEAHAGATESRDCQGEERREIQGEEGYGPCQGRSVKALAGQGVGPSQIEPTTSAARIAATRRVSFGQTGLAKTFF